MNSTTSLQDMIASTNELAALPTTTVKLLEHVLYEIRSKTEIPAAD